MRPPGVITASSSNNQMWRPLYWFGNGVQPTESPSMSLAGPPV